MICQKCIQSSKNDAGELGENIQDDLINKVMRCCQNGIGDEMGVFFILRIEIENTFILKI